MSINLLEEPSGINHLDVWFKTINTFPYPFDIDSLLNVIITNPQLNDILSYDGNDWINILHNLESLSNVIITNPQVNDVLQYDGNNWINTSIIISSVNNILVQWGGDISSTTVCPMLNGESASSSAVVPDVSTEFIIPYNCTGTRISYNSNLGDNTTTMELVDETDTPYTNSLFTLTASRGVHIFAPTVSFTQGDIVSICPQATNPQDAGKSTWNLILEETVI